jgi:hypothetical protein
MSNVSTVHDIKPFKAGDKALSGQRLAKVGYKSTAKNPALYPSVCVSVPHVDPADIRENLTALLPYIGTLIENTQDKIVRARYEATAGALKIIQDSEISVAACIGFLHAEANGSRLTIDAIEKWFDATLAERVTVWIGTKLGYDLDSLTPEQMGTMQKHCKVYRDIMSGLSSNRTILAQKQINGLRGALDLCENPDDPMVAALSTALDTVEGKNADDFI